MDAPRVRLRELSAATYTPHSLHSENRKWSETNCYVDLWIEVMHGLGLDPMPSLAFTLALDFEGDQYTFYKFSLEELRDLYGIEVQELALWKPLIEHTVEQIAQGRVIIPEVDSFYLPDTNGVAYQIDHVKTSIAIQDIDIADKRLGYFHNRSYYELSGDDFDGVFRLAPGMTGPNTLPPYTEIAKLNSVQVLSDSQLTERAVALTRRYVSRRPSRNPIAAHRDRFPMDLEWMRSSTRPNLFHLYAFATFRQVGSCFEIASDYLRWLEQRTGAALSAAATEFDSISETAKTFQFKLARAVTLKRDVDFSGAFDSMVVSWDKAMADLVRLYGD